MPNQTRRNFIGAAGTAVTVGLAGCSGGTGDGSSGGNDEPTTSSGSGSESTTSNGSGGSGGASASAELRLGVLLPFTGEYDWVGANVFPVVEMLAEQINDGGGVDGRTVTAVKADTEATVDASVSAAQKLINVDKVDCIIGPTSLTFTGVIDLIQENQVPVVTPTAGTTELDDVGGEYIFRTVPSDSLGGRAISRAARNEEFNATASYGTMALMVGKAPALQSFKQPVASSFEEFGGTLTQTLDYATGKSAYQAEVSKILADSPELICLVGTPEDSAKIMRAAFQAGYEGNWFVTQDQTNEDFLKLTENVVTDGILGLVEANNPEAVDSGRIDEFTSQFKSFAGKEPGIFAKNTFDAVNIATLAMVQAAADGDLTRANISASIEAVANPPEQAVTNFEAGASAIAEGTDINYEGLVGPCDFDEYGNISSPFAIMQANGDSWEQVATLPASEL